jgi:hypothetical protein
MVVRIKPDGSLVARHDELGNYASDETNDDRPEYAHLDFPS